MAWNVFPIIIIKQPKSTPFIDVGLGNSFDGEGLGRGGVCDGGCGLRLSGWGFEKWFRFGIL